MTLVVETNNKTALEDISSYITNKFNFQVFVKDDEVYVKDIQTQTKWAEFAEKMSGTFTHEDAEHLRKISKEFRENFEFRDLEIK